MIFFLRGKKYNCWVSIQNFLIFINIFLILKTQARNGKVVHTFFITYLNIIELCMREFETFHYIIKTNNANKDKALKKIFFLMLFLNAYYYIAL